MTMDTVRWGIIGCGDVTEVKSGPALSAVTGSTLVAVMRRTAHLAEDYARRHRVPRWYADAEALVADPDVNAVYVATPPASHLACTQLAARYGKPVYVEKPMARTHGECVAMIAACREAGVPLFTAYYRRALPRFERVRTLVQDGAIGTVRSVSVTLCRPHLAGTGPLPWRLDPAVSGGGLFVDLASHTLDLLDHILGPIAHVQGDAVNVGGYYEAEDTVTALLTFPGQVRGVGLWCFVADRADDRVEIVGSAGRVVFSTFEEQPVTLVRGQESESFAIAHPAHVQQPLIQSVVDALRGGASCPSTGLSGARTSRVMDALLVPYYQRRASPSASAPST